MEGVETFVAPLDHIYSVSASTALVLAWPVSSVVRTAPLMSSAPALISRLLSPKTASSLNVVSIQLSSINIRQFHQFTQIKTQLVDVLSGTPTVKN